MDELSYTAEESVAEIGRATARSASHAIVPDLASGTPKGFDWVYKRFIRDCVSGYEVVLAQHLRTVCAGQGSPIFYERLKRQLRFEFFDTRKSWRVSERPSGTVVHAFNRARNLRPLEVDGNLPLYWALDFNVDPDESIIAQKKGDDVMVWMRLC